MRQAKKTLWCIIGLAIGLPVLSILAPKPSNSVLGTPEFLGLLAISVLQAVLHVGAAILFLMGLGGFKAVLHKAYRAICAGLVIFGSTFIQVPFFHFYNLFESAWYESGGLALVYSLGTALVIWGLCTFAKGLGDTSLWVKPWFLLSLLALISIAGGFLANEQVFWSGFAAPLSSAVFSAAATVLALHVKSRAGAAYTNAMAWLFMALLFTTVSGILSAGHTFLEIRPSSFQIIPSLLSGILFVKAGYAFNKVKDY